MTIEEIQEIAETWFEWPDDRREYVTYTSTILFARAMYERGQAAERERIKEIVAECLWIGQEMTSFEEWADNNNLSEYGKACSIGAWKAAQAAERERIKQIIDEVGRQGNHDKWFDCADAIVERIEE